MLSVEKIVDIINKMGYKTYKFDYGIYTAYILNCFNWYKGYDSGFHNYKKFNGLKKRTFNKSRLNMAKRVCEDKASLTVNENMTFEIDDISVREYLLGNNEMTGILGQNDFWSETAKQYELTCALGTGAFEIVVEDLLKINDNIVAYENSKIKIVAHNAMDIIPLSWDSNGKITEVAFVDQYKMKNDTFVDMRLHILDDDGLYKIVNKKFKVLNYGKNKIINLEDESLIQEFNTGSKLPWFSVLKLPIINNFDLDSPMGASVLANSIDILKNIDDAFTILTTEYRYGTKKIFYSKNLLPRDEQNNYIAPDDADCSAFYYTGDDIGADIDGKSKLIDEHNPALRIDEICKGIENGLNYLSVMCGLGPSYYKFSAGSVQKTATEVVSENSSLYRNIHKDQLAVEKFILEIFKALIYVSNLIHKTSMNVNAIIKIKFDASITEDKVSIRERDLREVEKGIMTIEEYRAKYYDSDRRDS